MSEIAVEPLEVLAGLCQAARVRASRTGEKGFQLWSNTVWGPTKGSTASATLSAMRIVQVVCSEIDTNLWPGDETAEAVWLAQIGGDQLGRSFCDTVSAALASSEAENTRRSPVSRAVVEDIRASIDKLVPELKAVTDPKQKAVCIETALYLENEFRPAVQRSMELKFWLLRQELLQDMGAQLLTFGMRLGANGSTALSERVFLVLISASSIIAGFANPALGATLGAASLLTTAKSPTEIIQALSPYHRISDKAE